ncbi:oligosaccharide flippase family protein [Brachybacterium sp. p3-SID957]|uniref:oligosaccharide flippase family protein n=1 Tax=Brachybacterium sp. p3-SID957 TaxID=2916049 RepID=UPI00223B6AEF|nr:oligosaccharide flippase family protein [Brachybacterium sp. p3-SID957]MCT1776044.1 oligosaccharide flippase family protein [Brachybacterium sp. p3-SID957]
MNGFLSLARHSLTKLLAGNVSAQAIQFLTLVVIARLYEPDQVGAFGLATALAAAVFPWAALRLESAVPLSESPQQCRAIVATSLTAILLVSVATGIAVDVLRRSGLLGESATSKTGIAVAFLVISAASIALLNQTAVLDERYGLLSLRPVVQQGVTAVVQIGSGLVWPLWGWLVGGQVAGRLSAALVMHRATRKYLSLPTFNILKDTFRSFRRFPLVFTPSTIINALGQQLPILIAATLISAREMGGLSVAWQISLAPVALIAAAVSANFSGVLARKRRESTFGIRRMYLRVSGALFVVAVLVMALMVFFAPKLLILVLGESWRVAADYLPVLALVTGACLVANSVTTIFTICDGAFEFLVSNIARVLLILLSALPLIVSTRSDYTVVSVLFSALALGYLIAWALGLLVATRTDSRGEAKFH